MITGITIEADSVVLKGSDFDALCALAEENNRLRQELSLAEEGLANYALEVEHLRALAVRLADELRLVEWDCDPPKRVTDMLDETEDLRPSAPPPTTGPK